LTPYPQLLTDHALYEKFARLPRQEDRHGLLADASTIGTRSGWEERLRKAGFALRGHRLVRERKTLPRSEDMQQTLMGPSSNPCRLVRQVNEFAS
jgi:hypothetical protein